MVDLSRLILTKLKRSGNSSQENIKTFLIVIGGGGGGGGGGQGGCRNL